MMNFRHILELQRNSKEAIRLAKQACDATNHENPFLLVDLAASYAAAGRFPEAAATLEKALQPAQSLGDQRLTEEIQDRLKSYKQGKLYTQSVPEQPQG